MRIDLVTPFAEKDDVKALGARWDGARKVWYIKDVEDLTPFRRWLPQADGFIDDGQSGAGARAKKPPKPQKPDTAEGIITKSSHVPHCGCDVLPWLDCVHTGLALTRN